MQQNEIMGPNDLDRVIDFLELAHSRGEDDGLPESAVVAQEVIIGQRCRRDLVARRSELLQEVNGPLIPA